jgi:hypothetical protein
MEEKGDSDRHRNINRLKEDYRRGEGALKGDTDDDKEENRTEL